MPRSHGVIKVEVWEPGSGFRQLSIDAQWAYAMLISQPQINNLGVLPYVPEKWWRLSSDLVEDRLLQALQVLEDNRYTITDTGTRELLVRTFIRHDGVWKHPKLVTNARRLFRETESAPIRAYLSERHPWLTDETWQKPKIDRHETRSRPPFTPTLTPTGSPSDTPSVRGTDTPSSQNGETEPQTEPQTDGESPPRARAQDALPQDQGLGQDQGPDDLDETEGFTPHTARATNEQPFGFHTIATTVDESLAQARNANQ